MNSKCLKNIRKIAPYVPGEQSNDKDIVKLNANENPYPPSPMAVDALKNFDTDTLRFYPAADATPLKVAIADYYGVKKENVFLGNGSDDVIALSFMTFFNGDLPVLYPDITYSFYPVWCDLLNIKYKECPLNEDFRINIDDYKAPNGGIIIPNPNAPTSLYENIDFVDELVGANQDSVVIIDEAYVDFAEKSCVELVNKYDNLLVTATFSKSRSLAGMRIGFAIGSEQLISALEAVKNSYNSYTVDTASILMGVASVKDDDYFKSTVAKIIATRARLTQELRSLGFEVLDSSTNFIMATHNDFSMKDMFEYLKTKRVFIRYFNSPRINKYVRITIGTDHETDVLINQIINFIGEQNG